MELLISIICSGMWSTKCYKIWSWLYMSMSGYRVSKQLTFHGTVVYSLLKWVGCKRNPTNLQ